MGLIAKIQQLVSLSPEGTEWLAENIELKSFRKNEHILNLGRVCSHMYYINSGIVGGFYLMDGVEICNWIATENDLATAYYSFISRKPSFETIECFEDTTVQSISHDKMNEMYRLFPETERAGRLLLEEYYARLEERLIANRFVAAKERYKTLVDNRPEVVRRAPLGRIASYLGMKQETLSRIRAEK
jgi:CRP/FNR family transcriptional regulator, anaerobic regulatory protein